MSYKEIADLLRETEQKLIKEFLDDLRYLRHLGLKSKTYDAYVELSEKWKGRK